MYHPVNLELVGRERQKDLLREAEMARLVNLARNKERKPRQNLFSLFANGFALRFLKSVSQHDRSSASVNNALPVACGD